MNSRDHSRANHRRSAGSRIEATDAIGSKITALYPADLGTWEKLSPRASLKGRSAPRPRTLCRP